jgi:hypothetical protein
VSAEVFDSDTSVGWKAMADCRGRTRLFYSDTGASQRIAIAICKACPVRQQCEAEVRATERADNRFGVIAGFTANQRDHWDH